MIKTRVLAIIISITFIALIFSYFSDHTFSTDHKLAEEIQHEIDSGTDEIEVLIYLKKQLNTSKVAAEAMNRLSILNEHLKVKEEVRIILNEALQKNAKLTQEPLLNYLEEQKYQNKVASVESYYIVNMVYALVKPELIPEIASRNDVERIYLNEEITFEKPITVNEFYRSEMENIPWNIKHIGAPEVWNTYEVNGEGVVIGIIDTGVDWEHPALYNSWRGFEDGRVASDYNWYDPINNSLAPEDDNGHGTNVIGIAIGLDYGNNKHIGLAPGAKWIAYKSMNSSGAASKQNLLKAGQFMLAPTDLDGGNPRPEMAPDIIINSWGSSKLDNDEWYLEMVQNWRNAQIFSVFAAGNSGPEQYTINNPGNYPESFSVGAIDIDNKLATFSSRGPGSFGDMIKPEIVAPGVNIYTSEIGNKYKFTNGTSAAAPHVAGVAALLLSVEPDLPINELESILKETATPLTDNDFVTSPNYGFGYGLVNPLLSIENILSEHFQLTVKLEGKGNIEPDGTGIFFYPAGQEVTLEAIADVGWQFEEWKFNSTNSTDNILTINMEKDTEATAIFIEEKEYEESRWIIIDSPDHLVNLDDLWHISLNRYFETDEIDRIVIEKNGTYVPVDIKMKPQEAEMIVIPVNPYLPDETYCLKIFLDNSKCYRMYFQTESE